MVGAVVSSVQFPKTGEFDGWEVGVSREGDCRHCV